MTFTFGYYTSSINNRYPIKDIMRGYYFECPSDGEITQISANIWAWGSSRNVKCMCYKWVNNTTMGDLVGETETRLIAGTGSSPTTVEDFDIINGPAIVESGEKYFLVAWSTGGGPPTNYPYLQGNRTAPDTNIYKNQAGFPNEPDPGGAISGTNVVLPVIFATCEEPPSSGAEDLPAEFIVAQWQEDLPGEFIVRHSAFLDLVAGFTSQTTLNLPGEFVVRRETSGDLDGEFVVQHETSIDLPAAFEGQASLNLLGEFTTRHKASRDLSAEFEVSQGWENLPAEFITRHEASVDLAAEFIVRQSGLVNLPGEFIVRHETSADLLGIFNVLNEGTVSLLGVFEVRHAATLDLAAEFEVGQGSAELLGNVEVRQSGSAELLSTLRVSCPRLMGENWQRKMWFDGTYYWRGRYDSIGDELIFEYIASAGLAGNTWTKNASASINTSGFTGIDADFTVRGGESGIPTTIHYSDGVDTRVAESDEASATGWAWENTTVVFDGTASDYYRRVNLAANRTTPTPRLWAIALFYDQSEGRQWVKARRQSTGGDLTGWDAEDDISNVDNVNTIFGCSVRSVGETGPLKSDVMVVYKEGDALKSRYYDGDWNDPIEDIDTALSGHSAFDYEHEIIAGVSLCHLIYIDADTLVQLRAREAGATSVWSAATQLHGADVTHHSVGIVDHGSGWLWVMWREGDLIEFRVHDAGPDTWYPLLANDPLIFDVSTEAVVKTSTTAQLQTPDSIPSGEAVPICWIGETAPTTPCDVGWGILVEYSIASLKGVFNVRQPSSADLYARLRLGQDSADLLAKFDVGQDSQDLLGKFEAQVTAELLAKFDVGQDSQDLLGRFVAQGVADLLGRFVAQGVADLLGNAEIQQSGSAELLGRFEAQGVADLLAKFEAQGVADLLCNVTIRHSDSADLLGRFESQATVELLGEFVVNQWQEDLYAKFRISCPRLMGSNWQRKMWYDGTYYWRGRYDPIGNELIFEYIEADDLENNFWAKNAAASIIASGFTGVDADFTVRGETTPATIHYSDGVDTWVAESDEASATGWAWENLTKVFDGTDSDWYRSPNLCSDRQGAPKLWATAVFYDQSSGKQWVKASRETASGDITGWDAAVNVSNVDNTNTIYGESIRSMGAAAGVDVMVVYKEGAALRSRYYDGDWDDVFEDIDLSTFVGKSEWDFEHGMDPQMGHVLYVDANSSVQWRERDAGAASVWEAAEQVGADTSHTHRGVGIIEHGSGWLWATWANEDTVEVEYRLHLCSPEIWMPLLVYDPLTFDVTNAEVPTTTIAQLQTPDSQPAGSAVIITWIGETTPTTPCAAGWGIIIPRCHENLLGRFDVGQNSADLLGRFEAQGVADLLGNVEIQQSGSAELLGKFEAQGIADLLGKFDVGQDSQNLLGRFEAQATADLLGKFDVGQDSQDLLGTFEAQGIADLFGKFETQAVADLLANVEIQQSGPAELLGKFEVQQLGVSGDLISNFYVSPLYLTADEMLIGGRDRRMDLGGLDREMVVGGRDRRMKIK